MNENERGHQESGSNLDVAELAARLRPALIAVPGSSATVCSRCRSSKDPSYRLCYPCQANEWALGGFGLDVVPISLSLHLGQLHDHLRQYKDARDECVRYRMSSTLGGLLVAYLNVHGPCLGRYERIATVPSTRIGEHPFRSLVRRVRGWERSLVPDLGVNPAFGGNTHTAHPDRYTVPDGADVSGRSVLLLDDTLTTGASIQSAAYALAQSGATVIPLVIGRHIKMSWPPSASLLASLQDQPWRQERCGICGPAASGSPSLF